MDWITDQIAIGNFVNAREIPPEIDAVLCLAGECVRNCGDVVDVLTVPLHDGAGNSPRAIEQAIWFIGDVVKSGRRILVHCQAGRSSSVAIVAAYLVSTEGLDSNAALKLISARRQFYLSPGIKEIL